MLSTKPCNPCQSKRKIAFASNLYPWEIFNYTITAQTHPHAVRQHDNQNRLPIHYAANNLPDISTEALYKFCIEQDLTDSDDSRYYLDEEEAKMMFDD